MIHPVLTITLPIYLGIALGFIAVHQGWIRRDEVKALGRFAVVIGVPAMLFRGVSQQSIGAVWNPDYLAIYTVGSLVTMGLVVAYSWRLRGRPFSLAAMQGLGASSANSMFVGYPIALQVLGPVASVALALCTLVENLLIIPLGLALADAGQAQGGARKVREIALATLRSAVRNPMILAIALALVFSATGWKLPPVLDKTLGMVAGATSPIALFVIGGSLVGLRLQGLREDIAVIVGGKLLLHPLCVLAGVLLFPPTDPLLRSAAVLIAAMPMMSIYPVLAQRHGQEQVCSAALLAATLVSFFTIAALIAGLPAAWLPLH